MKAGNVAATALAATVALGAAWASMAFADDKSKDEIPAKVMATLKQKFPHAEIAKWTKEKEGEKFLYDIEFTQAGKKFEADIFEDGTIHNWEKAISAADLPRSVKAVVDKKYPSNKLVEIMLISTMQDGHDVIEGFEIVLKTADRKDVEVTVAQVWSIVEDSTEKKEEKK